MTFLQLVNDVLERLRETSVTTVTETDYSVLIGKFVNDAIRQVQDAWEWNSLSVTVPVTTVAGTSNYVVTGSGQRQRSIAVNDTTNHIRLVNVPLQWIVDQQQLTTVQTGNACYYAWNGTNGTDSKVELYPTPNAAATIEFNMYVPQNALVNDSDTLSILPDAVIAGAYARATMERGEDGGIDSNTAYAFFKNILADQIQVEATRFIENDSWYTV